MSGRILHLVSGGRYELDFVKMILNSLIQLQK